MNRRDTGLFVGERSYATGGLSSKVSLSQVSIFNSVLFGSRSGKFYILYWFWIHLEGVASQTGDGEQLVYMGNRDCHCFLVFALLVIFLVIANRRAIFGRDLSPPLLLRQTAFYMRSALNGSHGEATNSDDVVDHLAICEMVDSELEVALDHCQLDVSVRVVLYREDDLMNFALLCGAVTNIVTSPESCQGLVDSLFLVKLCIAEECVSSLSYTELLYDLFIYRNTTLKAVRSYVGETFFHFMKYDVDITINSLGSSPRESQLRSSHGEMTEGDDLAFPLQGGAKSGVQSALDQLSGCKVESCANSDAGSHNRVGASKRRQKRAKNKRVHGSNPGANKNNQPVVDVIAGSDPPSHGPPPNVISNATSSNEKVHRRVILKQVDWKDYVGGEALLKAFEDRGEKPFYYDGTTYTCISGEFAHVRNYQANCHSVGDGYVRVNQIRESKGQWVDDDDTNRWQPIIPLVGIYQVDGYRRNALDEQGRMDPTQVVVYPPATHFVLLPLYDRMKKLPNTGIDKLHSRATECSVDRVSSLLIPEWLISDTVAHRRAQLARAEVLHFNTEANMMLTKYGGAVGRGDLPFDTQLQHCSTQKFGFVHINHKRLKDLPTYPVRDDFTVIEGSQHMDQDGRVVFPIAEGKLREQYSTRITGFHGLNQPVGHFYANDAGGVNHGCKRVLGCKESLENELKLRGNAKSLGLNIMAHEGVLDRFAVHPDIGHFHVRGDYERSSTSNRTWWTGKDFSDHVKCWKLMTQRDPRINVNHPQAYPRTDNSACSRFIAAKAHKLALGCQRYQVGRILDGVRGGSQWVYYKIMATWLDVYHSAFTRQAISNLPHLKRKLRQAYFKGVRYHDSDNILMDRMKAAVKNELSKFGKAPRLYQQMGRGCLYAPDLVEAAKVLIDGIHVEKCGNVTMVVMVFGKRKDGDLEKLFNDMYEALNCTNLVMAGVYSDDTVIAGSLSTATGKEVFAYNVDVSSNDSSQDLPAFLTTFMILNQINDDRAIGLIEQCMKPIEIRNPEIYDQVVRVLFNGPFEGSGSTLTTLLNHVGSYLILMGTLWHMAKMVDEPVGPGLTVEQCVRLGAAEVGHSVTVEDCSDGNEVVFERLTFLHMHPARVVERPEKCCIGNISASGWIPRIDIGCILRKFGWVDGSLTHIKLGMDDSPASIAAFAAMSQQQQMDAYCGGVVRGWKNEASDPILDALRSRFTGTDLGVIQVEASKDASRFAVRDDLNYSEVVIDPGTLRNRYDLSDAEVEAIVSGISLMHVGTFVVTSGVAKILKVAYGISEVCDPKDQWERAEPVGLRANPAH